jgi:hypothetical protein
MNNTTGGCSDYSFRSPIARCDRISLSISNADAIIQVGDRPKFGRLGFGNKKAQGACLGLLSQKQNKFQLPARASQPIVKAAHGVE